MISKSQRLLKSIVGKFCVVMAAFCSAMSAWALTHGAFESGLSAADIVAPLAVFTLAVATLEAARGLFDSAPVPKPDVITLCLIVPVAGVAAALYARGAQDHAMLALVVIAGWYAWAVVRYVQR